MMCYRDKPFCPFLECDHIECKSRLTEEVKKNAAIWWGLDNPDKIIPIAIYTTKPDCYREKKNED